MRNPQEFLVGVAVGAGLMYLLDPDRGRRRRALLRDQVVHGAHELDDLGGAAASQARDLRNRVRGRVAETRSRLRVEVVDDSVLEARIRSELGRVVGHPGTISVVADHGRVTLSGQAEPDEIPRLVRTVESVRGVDHVVNRLQAARPEGDLREPSH